MKITRLHQIENYITQKGNASIDSLCSLFNVSKNTIRKDINELEQQGKIKKVYGGIILRDEHSSEKKVDEPFEARKLQNMDCKKSIAKCASDLVHDGDIIFIDSGTTTMHMVPFLAQMKALTIITNNLNVIVDSLPYPNLNVIAIGGTLSRGTNSFINMEAINLLKTYNFSIAFMATTGVSISKGVTNSSTFEYEIKKYIVENCDKVILLADNTKLGRASLITYYNLKDINIFVTDARPDDEYIDFFHNHQIELIISQEDKRISQNVASRYRQ